MNEMLATARRGLGILPRAPRALFIGSAAWTGLNLMAPWLDLGPLLIGPALVGLFHVAFKALREQETTWQDAFVAVREPATSLIAGIIFALPFTLWAHLRSIGTAMEVSMFGTDESAVPGVPMMLSLFLLIFFSVYVFVFARVADAGGSLADAVRFAHDLAERPARPDARLSGLGRQIVYCGIVFVALLLVALTWKLWRGAPFLFSALVAPPAVGLLAAWHDERIGRSGGDELESEAGAEAETEH